MKNLIGLLSIVAAFCSCSSTNLMSLSVLRPAPVTIPPYIKSVGILNRSRASSENRTIDAIHRTLSLETIEVQMDGAKASITGLSDELMKNDRFTKVKPLTDVDIRSFGAGVFPSSLDWDSVAKICRDNNTDALFALELFDAEAKVNFAGTPTSVNLGLANLRAVDHQVSMTTLVKTGWRIYDPTSKNVLDEYILSKDITSSGSGIGPSAESSSLIGRKEAIKQVSNQAGQAYALRILPFWIRVSRDYFVRGDANFSMATRMARAGNWDGAGRLWKSETTNPNNNLSGRACYNMAIISEINGDLDGAIQWAQQAYEIHKIGLALPYLNILRNRKANNEILMSQNTASITP